jgi:hypothetical protein
MHIATTHYNKFTQVLYLMQSKSIISLISIFLISMLFGPIASAGPTYVNVEIPKECGTWKYNASRSHHCAGTGRGSLVKAGRNGSFKCVGGGNGRGNLMIEMSSCPTVVFNTAYVNMMGIVRHRVTTSSRKVVCISGCKIKNQINPRDLLPGGEVWNNSDQDNTKNFEILSPVRYCTGGSCESNPGKIWN